MLLGICFNNNSFTQIWIDYCEEKSYNWKALYPTSKDFIEEIKSCDGVLWHFSQNSHIDTLIAKQIIHSIELLNIPVFPNSKTAWHFDDKIGQFFLLKTTGEAIADTHIFFSKKEAIDKLDKLGFPLVHKLRGGAGSLNVKKVNNIRTAKRIIQKSFKTGYRYYYPVENLKERLRLYKERKAPFSHVIKGIYRLVKPPEFSRLKGSELGYVYFQEFIPNNHFDIRVIVIKDKAFAIKRLVRKNDFRASGSGNILYNKEEFPVTLIKSAFELSEKLHVQCVAIDYIYKEGKPIIVEVSYGFEPKAYIKCPGYWDQELKWHEGSFNQYGWIIDNLRAEIDKKSKSIAK